MMLKSTIAFFILLMIALLPACSQREDASEITGEVAAKIYRACQYPNGDFCDSNCCISREKCNGNDAYSECDLETGKWKTESYSDASCSKKCVPVETPKEKGCGEGWECVDEKYKGYKTDDCKWKDIEKCPQSCKNGECTSLQCTPPAMKCFGNELKVCNLDGSSWGLVEKCEHSCIDDECTDGEVSKNNLQDEEQTQPSGPCDNCIEILEFNYDPAGNECNTDDEFVEFRNKCSSSCSLDGWKVSDSASKTYTFSGITLDGSGRIKLYSGQGSNDNSEVYWGNARGCVWNNDGDTLTMKNSDGNVVLTNTY